MLRSILQAAYYIEHGFDKIRWSYLKEFNRLDPLSLAAYRGMGNSKKAYISGRLVEDRGIRPGREQDSKWRNLREMYKRFESFEVPGARIQAEFYGLRYETKTDAEGYFEFRLEVPASLDTSRAWHQARFRLLDKLGKNNGPVTANSKIIIPQAEAEYGIISDIDDTVLQTGATNFIRMMQKTFLYNAKTRLPFEGVAAFYHALYQGSTENNIKNPVYYVSSSPWNLYDMLEDFWEVQGLPPGPFMLRDLAFDPKKLFKSAHHDHKLSQIENIFEYTGDMPFILIGDSGQHDPEIYREVVRNHPGRVMAIYIRDVSKERRDRQVYAIIDEMQSKGTEMLFVMDTEAATRHAIDKGYIQPKRLEEVKTEKSRDISGKR